MSLDVQTIRDKIGDFIRDDVDNGGAQNFYDEYGPTDAAQYKDKKTYAPRVETSDPVEWTALWHYPIQAIVEALQDDFGLSFDAYAQDPQSIPITPTTIDYDTERVNDGPFQRVGGELEVGAADRYRVDASSAYTSSGGGGREIEVRLEWFKSGFDEWQAIPGTIMRDSWGADRSGGGGVTRCILDLDAGDKVRQVVEELAGGSMNTVANSCSLTITAFE